MYVKIGNYRGRCISNIHDRYMNWKYGRNEWEDNRNKFEFLLEKYEDLLQTVYNKTINKFLDKRSDQKIKVRIDRWDTWSADNILAHIIHPILVELKQRKQGAPLVDDEDVPEELRSTSVMPKENEWDIDDNHFKRWDYVLDEMTWAFSQKLRNGGWEGDYYKYEDDPEELFGIKLVWEDREGSKAHQERMSNGFRLFGKYFENLWS
jgi:hypothetical protein